MQNQDIPIFDPESLNELKETIGSDKANDIIISFFELVKENINNAAKSLDKNDYDEFEQYCHKIKSNVAYIGGKRLQDMCVSVEHLHSEGNIEAIALLGKAFKDCAQETVQTLEQALRH